MGAEPTSRDAVGSADRASPSDCVAEAARVAVGPAAGEGGDPRRDVLRDRVVATAEAGIVGGGTRSAGDATGTTWGGSASGGGDATGKGVPSSVGLARLRDFLASSLPEPVLGLFAGAVERPFAFGLPGALVPTFRESLHFLRTLSVFS